jgi:hypothetical protein
MMLTREPALIFRDDCRTVTVAADDKTVTWVSGQLSFVDESLELPALSVEGHFVGVLYAWDRCVERSQEVRKG